jgi:CRP/FNR family transcriptional regulator, cyclic AMP receptor protein
MASTKAGRFDAQVFLELEQPGKPVIVYSRSDVIFSQGDPSESVIYLRSGEIRLSVLSRTGKEAIVGVRHPGDFLGEGALAGEPVRLTTAIATMATSVRVVPKPQMIRLLRTESALSDRFIAHMLARNVRLEADLIDQLFNVSEKRLARTLLLLARAGSGDNAHGVLPRISQGTLAEMVGTTRSRVNFFMRKFKRLGFINDDGGLKINPSLETFLIDD